MPEKILPKKGFRQRLKERQEAINSLLCVGLDPLPEKMPECMQISEEECAMDIVRWMIKIVDATAPFTSMYKPQKAHWEAFKGGSKALWHVVRHIKRYHPDIPIFLDCKRGDIGRTQERYKIAHFEIDEVEGINFNPYMGKDCMEFLADKNYPERALVGLCYTSNPSAREIQDLLLDGKYLWEIVAEKTLQWAEDLGVVENAGLVMAAAYERPHGIIHIHHLVRVRQIVGNKMWFLIPGVGTQGGYVNETVKAAFAGYGSMAVNSSSDIIFASSGKDFAEAAADKAMKLRDAMRPATYYALNPTHGIV